MNKNIVIVVQKNIILIKNRFNIILFLRNEILQTKPAVEISSNTLFV